MDGSVTSEMIELNGININKKIREQFLWERTSKHCAYSF